MELADVLDVPEQLQILESLTRLTASGTLSWGAGNGDTSVATAGDHRYRLSSVDKDGEPPYRLSIERRMRIRPESKAFHFELVASIVMRGVGGPNSDQKVNALMRNLFESAYRQSRRKSIKFEEILRDLSDVESGKAPPF